MPCLTGRQPKRLLLWAVVWGCWATTLGALAQEPKKPRVVILPFGNQENVRLADALMVWKAITTAVEGAQIKLALSMELQDARHDFLIGPAREQAAECGFRSTCLREIGSTLGAEVLIAGAVGAELITIVVLDVETGKRITRIRSSMNLVDAPPAQKAGSAARNLIYALTHQEEDGDAETAPSPGEAEAEQTAVHAEDPTRESVDPTLEHELAPQPRASPAPEEGSEFDGAWDEDEEPPPSLEETEDEIRFGTLLIKETHARRIRMATLDGESLERQSDGELTWTGLAGSHTLRIERANGTHLTQTILVRPNQVTIVDLALSETEAPHRAARTDEKWWFWVAISGAILLGATTAVALGSGTKGGPSARLPSE